MADDRDTIVELQELLRQAKDKARWLSIHRGFRLAQYVESNANVALRMTYDLRAEEARRAERAKEPT